MAASIYVIYGPIKCSAQIMLPDNKTASRHSRHQQPMLYIFDLIFYLDFLLLLARRGLMP